MTDEKDKHLNIDLDFLDKKEPQRTRSVTPSSNSDTSDKSDGENHTGRNVLIGIGVVIFFIWLFASGSDSNSGTSSSNISTSGMVRVGQYNCSQYYADQSDSMLPIDSKDSIESARNLLTSEGNQLDNLKSAIDSSYVTEYSAQYEIDQYNDNVNEYNSNLAQYKSDLSKFNARVDRYNEQINKYNNYLSTNCTKVN